MVDNTKRWRNVSKKPFKRYLKVIFLSLLVFLILATVVIKTQAGFAAKIADGLRPLIGTDRVTAMEQFFFNASDDVSQIEYKFKDPSAPEFLAQTASQDPSNSLLDLSSIPKIVLAKNLKNEGVWKDISSNVFPNKEVMAYTFVRPDPGRLFSIVSLVQMDTSLLKIGAVAGTAEPGGSLGNPGSGTIPKDIIDSGNLLAAFNGGFLYVDGHYGMIANGITYAPLKNNTGTIVGYTDGTIKIINYTGQSLGKDVVFARQNGPLIINDGKIALNTSTMKEATGRTLHGGSVTWRSGFGVTKSGNVIYAAGNNLSPVTLATALRMAGAINAIQLDINPSQVRLDLFNKNSSGSYDVTPLNKELAFLSNKDQYLKGYKRDFFYVYKK